MIIKRKHMEYCISFCSFGIVGHVDRKSESLRWVGSLRFTLAALYNVLIRHLVRAKVTYKFSPISNVQTHPIVDDTSENYSRQESVAQSFWEVICMNTPYTSHDIKFGTFSKPDDGYIDLSILPASVTRLGVLVLFVLSKNGKHITSIGHKAGRGVSYYKCHQVIIEPQLPTTYVANDCITTSTTHFYDIDGEFFQSISPIYLNVRPRLLRVFQM